ncbi:flagellar filament capping protein FliD [Thauera sp. 2A1]|uniref:flagellar filament capping protein FliD n=1 Tax=Thauera sp. 2A1 TaxID=2570191 RepID=UPI001290CF23|nr:flagellar filament capping protein FliD [Thauera sp. 2A1]KAI5916106.1 flagellar filament capping protein FliD [Thauera sp. 2A1]
MAISAAGVGSGLDVGSIVSQLMAVERQPLTRLQDQQKSYQSKLSAFGQLQSAMSKLQDAAATLAKSSTFSATTANAGDTKAFTVTSTASAQTGSYNLEVTQLARAQRTATSATVAPDLAGGGSLTITLGSGTPKTVNLEDGATLQDLRDAINAADAGVSAQIVNNGTVNQLVISSKETGAANAFKLEGTGGLSAFSFDPAAPAGDMVSVQQARDAKLSIDGLAITRSSNTVSDAIDGVTLTLVKPTDGETAVTVARDDDTAKKAIDDFAKAYNDLNSLIRSQTSYDAATKKAGTLNGDASVRSIQGQLRSVFTNPMAGLSGATMLSQVGISFKTDGSMSVDSKKLAEALADPSKKIGELFAGNGTVDGVAKTLETRIKDMLGTDGLLSARTEGINRTIKSFDSRIDTLEVRLEKVQARYSAQFTALDATMSSLNTTSAYLTQQLSRL